MEPCSTEAVALSKQISASVNAAAASAAGKMPDDFRVSITDAPGEAAYPISSFTWILVPSVIPDATRSAGPNQVFGVGSRKRAGLS